MDGVQNLTFTNNQGTYANMLPTQMSSLFSRPERGYKCI
nr:MAG TPA: hypothetical protein [Caudoviricetes sp.]